MNWICEYMYCQKDLLGIHVRFSMIDLNLIRNKQWLRVSQHLSIFLPGCSTSWEFSINKASTPKWITSPKRHGLCVYPTCDIAHHSQKWQKAQETYLAIGYHRLRINHSLPHWGKSCLLPQQLFWSPLAASTEEEQASNMSWNSDNDDWNLQSIKKNLQRTNIAIKIQPLPKRNKSTNSGWSIAILDQRVLRNQPNTTPSNHF